MVSAEMDLAAFWCAKRKEVFGNIEEGVDVSHADEAKAHPFKADWVNAVVLTVQLYGILAQ